MPLRAKHLLVGNAIRLEPVASYLLEAGLAVGVPLLADVEAIESTPKDSKRSASVDGVEEFVFRGGVTHGVAEALHDRPFVNVERRGQAETRVGFDRLADAGQQLALPVGKEIRLRIFQGTEVVLGDRDDLARVRIEKGLPLLIRQVWRSRHLGARR